MPSSALSPISPPTRLAPLKRFPCAWVGALLLLVYVGSAWIRIQYSLRDPGFDVNEPTGLLKSDPGLLYYITERVIAAGGSVPENFRSDPGPAWPETSDLPAMFAVGEEFLIAWAWKIFGGTGPLHVFIVKFMAWIASLAVFAVFGLTYELTRKPGLALLATALYAVLPYNYRTVGMILLREDLSFPLYATHLWLCARAVRINTQLAWALCGVSLTLGLATWHALGFFLNLEVAALWLCLWRAGYNPCAGRKLATGFLLLVCGGLFIPVLQAKNTLASPAVIALFALVLSPWAARLQPRLAPWPRVTGSLVLLLCFGTWHLLQSFGIGAQADYSHVTSFLFAKLKTLGQLPSDPAALPFDVRLLWQGPFVTAEAKTFLIGLGACVPLALALLADFVWQTSSRKPRPYWLVGTAYFALAIFSAWLVERTMILAALVAPALGAAWLLRSAGPRLAASALSLATLAQGAWFLSAAGSASQTWYQPPEYTRELRHLVEWAERNLPKGEGVLGDFVASTALLARSQTPIVLQPKYETAESRRRIEEFYTTFVRGSLADLAQYMRRYRTRYLLVDRRYLWWGNRYILGIPAEQKVPTVDTPAWHFIQIDQRVLEHVPGFRLLYRSPEGLGNDYFRVYELIGQ